MFVPQVYLPPENIIIIPPPEVCGVLKGSKYKTMAIPSRTVCNILEKSNPCSEFDTPSFNKLY